MAAYLSRHPSKYEGASIQAKKLFNDWFTVNLVDDITPKLTGLANSREPIRSRENAKLEQANVNRKLTVLDKTQTNKVSEIIAKPPENELMAFNNELASSKTSNVYIQANAENDRLIQKVISLVRSRNNAVIARLPPPWREKCNSFSVSENGLLYMDNRLVIPKDMRENVLRAIHFGHARRDAMLREASDFWWPRVHREIVEMAKNCTECQQAGKNLKCLKSQNEFGKLPETHKPNEEIALDFARLFQNANQKKKYLLVLVDNHSGWPNAFISPNPTTEKATEFVLEYRATNGLPKRIRTDPGTVFKSEKFKQFCSENFIDHVKCPVRDHREISR